MAPPVQRGQGTERFEISTLRKPPDGRIGRAVKGCDEGPKMPQRKERPLASRCLGCRGPLLWGDNGIMRSELPTKSQRKQPAEIERWRDLTVRVLGLLRHRLLRQPGGSRLRAVVDERDALPLVLELREVAPAAVLALLLRGRCAAVNEQRLRQSAGGPDDGRLEDAGLLCSEVTAQSCRSRRS